MVAEKKTLYEPPYSKPLTAYSVIGQEPQGACKSGSLPWYDCVNGPSIIPACTPTGGIPDTSDCVLGGYHTIPTCSTGLNAATICISGSSQIIG